MKVTCPKCSKVVQAPDEWAGRKVKCPGCKDMIKLPASQDGSATEDLGFDIGSFGALEGGEVLVREQKGKPLTLKEAQKLAAQTVLEQTSPAPGDPTIRICPKCRQKVRCVDPYAEVMCGYCGTGIAGRADGNKAGYRADVIHETPKVTFYAGFTAAIFYPVRALASMLGAVFILPVAVLAPLAAAVALITLQGQNEINKAADFSWLFNIIAIAGKVMQAYLGAIGIYVLVDTLRVTLVGEEIPPPLTYSPARIIAILTPYLPIVGIYGVLTAVAYFILGGFTQDNIVTWVIVAALLGLPLPMLVIGVASSKPSDGLNPQRVFMSIGRTLGHYLFLDLLLVLYGAMAAAMIFLVSSLGDQFKTVLSNPNFAVLLASFIGWAALLSAGLYCSYMLGRLIGLFARTFKEKLNFEF